MVCSGPWTISWNAFESLAEIIVFWDDAGSPTAMKQEGSRDFLSIDDHIRKLKFMRQVIADGSTSLSTLALISNVTSCKDAKDKVYALLGCMSEAEARLIQPDYAGSKAAAYATATWAAISSNQHLGIWRIASIRDRAIESLPTWAVNFAFQSDIPGGVAMANIQMIPECRPRPWTRAHSCTATSPAVSEDCKFLTLNCLRFDNVRLVQPLPKTFSSSSRKMEQSAVQHILSNLEQAVFALPNASPYRTASPRGSPCRRLECQCPKSSIDWSLLKDTTQWIPEVDGHSYIGGFTNRRLLQTLYSHWSFCVTLRGVGDLQTVQVDPYNDPSRQHDDYAELVGGRPDFFVTNAGFFGTAPYGIQPGDCVVLPHGSDAPVRLRRDPEDGMFEFRGFGYVQGIVQGELLELCQDPALEEVVVILK